MRLFALTAALAAGWAMGAEPPYRDVRRPFGERAVDLVSRLTPEERAQQLLCGRSPRAPGVGRLGIRPYEWWSEALHGVARDGTATSFPTGLGLAATWDPELIERMARTTSDEARDKFNGRKSPHGLAYWSPTVNLSRDPRWGRAEEAYGEDPYLTARIGQAFVEGMQGAHEPNAGGYLKTFATPKHFLANNSEGNRLFGSSNVSERDLREYYTYAFKWLVERAGAESLMTSYNAVNGVPMTVHREILEGLVRRTWGFKGYITTDCDTLDYVVSRHAWRPEGWQGPWTRRAAVAYAVRAGVNANCGRSVAGCIRAAIRDGLLREDDLDLALVRLFAARMRSGEFDPDGGPFGAIGGCTHSPAAQALAEEVAENAVVLLQNRGALLPLKETLRGKEAPRLVLVGQRADRLTLGDYSTHEPRHATTILEGVREAFLRHFPKGRFAFVRGGVPEGEGPAYLMNVRPPQLLRADGSVVRQLAWRDAAERRRCTVEPGGNLGYMRTGSPAFVRFSELDLSEVAAFRFPVAGPGQAAPTRIEVRQASPTGTLMATLTVAERTGGWQDYRTARAELLGGGHDGRHRDVCFVFRDATPRCVCLSPEEEATIREADAVVVFADTAPGEKGFYENSDGEDLALPRGQTALIQRVAALNPRTAVYLQTVSQSDVEPYRGAVGAILWSTYNGQAQGKAAGRLLMGDVSPSARLPFTWYADVGQLADIRDYTLIPGPGGGKGRTYRHFVGDVAYPFGHGLTYSRFAYANLAVSAPVATPDDTLTVAFDLTNVGPVPAAEVAQLYVASPGADGVRRPLKRLCAFRKVALAPGETRRVALRLPVRELWFWDSERKAQTYDQDTHTLQVGPDAHAAGRLTVTFALRGALTRRPHALVALPSGHFLRLGLPGQRITVAPSVSYNDQTVRTDLPIRYASSAPDVAAVDAATGTVTPLRPGLATVTATYTEGSVTVRDDFPVCVLAPVSQNTP